MNSKVHFTPLNRQELRSRIKSLISNNIELIIWIKGRAAKESYRALQLDADSQKITVKPYDSAQFVGKDILYKFEIAGSHYFGIGKLEKDSAGLVYIKYERKLYKSERRSSYRLLTYPTYDVKTYFTVSDDYQGENVVDIRTGKSQTNIFKNFLKIIGQKDETATGLISLRVLDLSVSGLSFIIGELEKNLFKENTELKSFMISFDGEEFEIPKANVVYVVDYIQSEKKNIKQFKVGIKFSKVSINTDSRLGQKINKMLRENESNDEFEEFVDD